MSQFTHESIVTGSVDVNNFPATQPVSGTVAVSNPGLTDTQLRATPVPVSGTVSVGAPSTLATVTNVSVGTSVVTLSASNAAKKRVHVYNETGTLFVKLGSAASASSYTFRLTANTAIEIEDYAGLITAIKVSGTTPVLVTEVGI